ncbi:MAG: hypothetical protein JWR73_2737 [Tardiphaga sp.]|nr:hypothetical protein [Tardiphaga sp.]
MVPLPMLFKAFSCNRNKLNKWKADGHLIGNIPDGVPGVATLVDDDTALEISLMSAATSAGYGPTDAREFVKLWLSHHRIGQLDPIWVFDPVAGLLAYRGKAQKFGANAISQAREQVDLPLGAANRPSLVLRLINVEEVVSRLNQIKDQFESIENFNRPAETT